MIVARARAEVGEAGEEAGWGGGAGDDAAAIPAEAEALKVSADRQMAAEDVDAADDGGVGGAGVVREAEEEAVRVALKAGGAAESPLIGGEEGREQGGLGGGVERGGDHRTGTNSSQP